MLAFLTTGVLIAIVAWSAAALVPACGANDRVAGTWLDWCPVNKAEQAEQRLAALERQNQELVDRILRHERELALLQCEPKAPQQAALPDLAPIPDKIDRQDWVNQRIGLLEGCWELDSRFVTTNRRTGVKTDYNQWTMCFDASGNGREEMRADNGNSCAGPVTGAFAADGSLIIDEPGNLQCSDGGYIYRLSSSCKLNESGTASCVVTQPEVGSSTTVEFRRPARGN